MSIPFPRSMRSLNTDRHLGSTLGLAVVMAVLGGWLVWIFLARVVVYETTGSARLEVDSAAHPVESQVFGRVAATHLTIGKEVKAGEVLVELESEAQLLQLGEEQTRVESLSAQLRAVRDRDAAEQQTQLQLQQSSPVVLDEARAKFEEAEAVEKAAAEGVRRLTQLKSEGLIADMDLVRAKAEADKLRAAADALRIAITRQDQDQRVKLSDRRAQLQGLKGEIALLAGEIPTRQAIIERLKNEIEKRFIRASTAGRLGEVVELRVGSVVREGEKLGAILPSGALRVIAEFPPSQALGRVQPGQHARLRLAGFPWTEYGSVAATVSNVAGEPRAGHVRVEFAIHPDPTSPIPLQHGLPGVVEVEVERVSPAALALRAAGKRLNNLATRTKGEANEAGSGSQHD